MTDRAGTAGKVRRKRGDSASADATQVLIWLRRLIRAIDIHSKRVAKRSGLTVPQIVILQAVATLGEVTANRLSAEVDLSPPTVSTILERLESRGHIERYRSPTDRRVVHTRLTTQGRRALRRAPPLLQDSFGEAFARLGRRDRERIVGALSDVAKMMGAAEIEASPLLLVEPATGGIGGRSAGERSGDAGRRRAQRHR